METHGEGTRRRSASEASEEPADLPEAQDDGLFLSLEVRKLRLVRLSKADVLQDSVIVQTAVLEDRSKDK